MTGGNEILRRVGKRAKDRRKELGISIKQLAKQTNLSSALLSRIENGFISPSISTLQRMSDKLDVDIAYFFQIDDQKGYAISYRGKRQTMKSGRGSYLVEPLTNGMENAFMDVAIVTLEDKSDKEVELIQHNGQEFLYVLEGKRELTLGEKKFVLNKGDAAYFLCEIPHGSKNMSRKASSALHVHLIPGKRQRTFEVMD
jgi:transcriptional regulator with XRE-family HTH domain